jgi:two-component system, NarL family, response regulator YdfI
MMSPKGKITVVLADDTLIAREGWKKILETSEEIKVIGEARTASQATKIAAELKPQVMLMDLKWFGDETAGWTAIKEIKKDSPEVKIVAVTAYENLIRDARLAGADSAMLKTFTRQELLDEILEQASRPETTIAPVFTTSRENLTNRELLVLKLMADGHRDKEIAVVLEIAPTTAKNHVKSILEKLGAKNRTQAVSLAKELGLIK